MDSLSTKVLTQSVAFLAAAAIPIFLPAWSLDFWQAWLYLLAFGASMLAVGLYFAKHDPRLVERRMHVGMTAEKEPTQKIIQGLASFLLVAMFVTTGLDHQFRWSNVSPTISIVADALIALSFYVIFLTFKENTFAASTVTVEKDQAVVSTGPYAIVRHPMYAGAVILFVASPLALGSVWALIPGVLVLVLLVFRLLDEEKFLSANLSGYTDYCGRVTTRLIPFVW